MKTKQPTIAISYGFCEGRHLARGLKRCFEDAGFQIISDIESADIILAHSGTCWLIPIDSNTRLTVMVGLPFWPGKSLFTRWRRKMRDDFLSFKHEGQLKTWARKTSWNSVYFWNIGRTSRMFIKRSGRNLKLLHIESILCVRNDDDAFCTPDIEKLAPLPSGTTYARLPGQHDDLWQHPERYVTIIRDIWHDLGYN